MYKEELKKQSKKFFYVLFFLLSIFLIAKLIIITDGNILDNKYTLSIVKIYRIIAKNNLKPSVVLGETVIKK